MLAQGAAGGLVIGLISQPVVARGVDAELVPVVRVALLLPALIFVAWWLLLPGMSLRRERRWQHRVANPDAAAESGVGDGDGRELTREQRAATLEAAFTPWNPEATPDSDVAATYAASIRRDEAASSSDFDRDTVRPRRSRGA